MKIEKYLERIKVTNSPKVSEDGLFELQSSQLRTIPFENIDCFNEGVINTDWECLENKIITNHRGGYCFELNGLFSFVLDALGFNSRPLLARVMYRGVGINARTHIILLIDINGKKYIADAGFGGPSTYLPIPFEINREDVQSHGTFRIIKDETHQYLMQKKTDDGWFNVYGFTLDLVYPADLAMSNFYTSTFPESHFRHNLILARHLPNGRYTLLNLKFTSNINNETIIHDITNQQDLLEIIQTKFDIKLNDKMNFFKLFKKD